MLSTPSSCSSLSLTLKGRWGYTCDAKSGNIDLWLRVGALHLLLLLSLMRHTTIILLIQLLFTWLFCSVGICTVFTIFTLLLRWYLHCFQQGLQSSSPFGIIANRSPRRICLFVLYFNLLLLFPFFACFHSGLPPSLGSFWFSTFKFVCFQVFFPAQTSSLFGINAKRSPTLVS